MESKKIAVRYVIFLWFAVVSIAYYGIFLHAFPVHTAAWRNSIHLLRFVSGLIGKIF